MRRQLAVLILTTVLTGCSILHRPERVTPEQQLERGLMELRRGKYEPALEALTHLVAEHPDTRGGQRARVVLTAAHLDPRNPARDLDAGATRAAGLVLLTGIPDWQRPVSETLYLLSVELGGQVDTAAIRLPGAEADAERARAGPLPALPGATVPARLAEGAREEDQLRERIAALEQQLADRGRELAKVREELERIRRTIRP